MPIARAAGLPKPETQAEVNGFPVDFYWRDLGLVVETDGGAFHRTPTQQTRERIRDHAHTITDLTPLRFTHHQVAHDAAYLERVLEQTRLRLARRL